MLKTGLDLTDALGQGSHDLGRATDIGSVIAVSWTVQAVKGQQGIEELEPKRAAHLSRHPRLNESSIGARGSLDEDHRQTHEREEKRAIRGRISHPCRVEEIKRHGPRTQATRASEPNQEMRTQNEHNEQ